MNEPDSRVRITRAVPAKNSLLAELHDSRRVPFYSIKTFKISPPMKAVAHLQIISYNRDTIARRIRVLAERNKPR